MNVFQQTEPEVRKPKGENVRHICRVTGYFSWIEGWNKGKLAELAHRHRSDLEQSAPGKVSYFDWYEH